MCKYIDISVEKWLILNRFRKSVMKDSNVYIIHVLLSLK